MFGLLKWLARQLASPLRAAGPGKCQVAAFSNALTLARLRSWLRRPPDPGVSLQAGRLLVQLS